MNAYYGIGIIQGQLIDEDFIRKRPKHVVGPLTINGKTFTAASGSPRRYGCPWGTFVLNAQPIGSIIARLYRRYGIDPREEQFNTVWNVGLPNDITGVGYDVPVKRRRSQIQLHCDPALKSMGCIVLTKEHFVAVVEEIRRQEEELAIEVAPAEDGVEYRIFPRPKYSEIA